MSILASALSDMGSALLPLASVLLLEELTYGGLVRLLLRPKPVPAKSRCGRADLWLLQSKQSRPCHGEGERKCLR